MDIKRSYTFIEKLEIELIIIAMILVLGSRLFAYYEHVTFFDALYFSVITMAGVGYGDIVPMTYIGKIIAMFYAIVGMPLFLVASGLILQSLLGKENQ